MAKLNYQEWLWQTTQMIRWLFPGFPIKEEVLKLVYEDQHFKTRAGAIEYICRVSINPSGI